jgi:hypothetical protein
MARHLYWAALGLLALSVTASADLITLTLTPSGTVSGSPGDTIGWGYTIINNSTDFLLVSNSYFCAGAEDPAFTTCAPSLGASTYQDFIASNGTEIAPGATAAQSFDASTNSGVGGYAIDPAAIGGQSDIGSIFVIYNLYTADPFGPNCNSCQDGGDMEISASAEVQVNGPVGAVPEPAAAGLVVAGLLLFGVAMRNRFNGSRSASHSSI